MVKAQERGSDFIKGSEEPISHRNPVISLLIIIIYKENREDKFTVKKVALTIGDMS